MARTQEEQDLLNGLDKLEAALAPSETRSLAGPDLCAKYHQIRPTLVTVVAIVKKIPFLGKVVVALEFLMTLADSLCPTR